MKKLICLLAPIGFCFFVMSCRTQSETPQAQTQEQAQAWAAQEAARSFKQITTDNDAVVGDPGILQHNFYCIDKKEERLFFLKGQRADQWNIWMKKLDGSNLSEQRTYADYKVLDPAVSPDGRHLAYCDQREKGWNIYTISAAVGISNISQITSTNNLSLGPVFFPNKLAILYCETDKDKAPWIWSKNLDNTENAQLCVGFSPSFFADGKKMVFVRTNLATKLAELFIYDFERSSETLLLSDEGKSFYQPSVSPNGKYVAYTAITSVGRTKRNYDVYMIDLMGKRPVQVTHNPGNDLNPKWSQDSRSLYILSQRGGTHKYNIWKCKAWQ